jgi:hypothetical protein
MYIYIYIYIHTYVYSICIGINLLNLSIYQDKNNLYYKSQWQCYM